MMKLEEVTNAFTYHSPTDAPNPAAVFNAHERVREAGKVLAEYLFRGLAPSAERTLAIRKVQEAVMWANAAIALDHEAFCEHNHVPPADVE